MSDSEYVASGPRRGRKERDGRIVAAVDVIPAPPVARHWRAALPFAISLLIVAAVLVVGLNRPDEPTVGTVTGDLGPSRAWMADLIQTAEDYGFSVAGLSASSARFIPVTPSAAWVIREGAWSQTSHERKPAGYGSSFREAPPPGSVLGKRPDSPRA